MSAVSTMPQHRALAPRLIETTKHFWHLGLTAFGGPGVHVVILRKKFVDQLQWLDSTTFADLFSLGNALPGPGSTQLAFSIAVVRNGTLAGLLAFFIWSLPASCGMAALAAGIRNIPNTLPDIVTALLTGLNAAAVGLIALAAYQLSSAAVTDKVTRLIVFLSASFGICYHAPWMYPVLMAVGGLATLAWDFRRAAKELVEQQVRSKRKSKGKQPAEREEIAASMPQNHVSIQETEEGIAMQVLPKDAHEAHEDGRGDISRSESPEPKKETFRTSFDTPTGPAASSSSLRQRATASSSITPPSSATQNQGEDQAQEPSHSTLMTPSPLVAAGTFVLFVALLVTVFSVRGAITHGGNTAPRALDLLANMVASGTIIFGGGPVVIPLLRGYTVDPGWVSNRDFLLGFAILQAFPGPNFAFACYLGLLSLPSNPVLGAVLGYVGIFSPGILLKLALLPLYNKWRRYQVAKSVLRGLNAAAAGLVYVAVWQLFLVGYIYTPPSASPGQVPQSVSGPLTADPFWAVVAAGSFIASHAFSVYPAISIIGGGLAGLCWYGVVSR